MNNIKKKYKLIKTVLNIYDLKLIFPLVNIIQQQILRKKIEIKILILNLKKQEILEEELNYSFIKINTNNDLDYEISYIQKFINDIKDIKIKKK